MPAEKRERKAPEKLVYDAPEPKAKKPKAAKKVAGAKKEKKAKKGYKGAMGAYMFFVQENRSEVTTSLISSCFVLYSFGAGHHQQSRCIIRRGAIAEHAIALVRRD